MHPHAFGQVPETKRSAMPVVLSVGILGVAFYIFFATLRIKS